MCSSLRQMLKLPLPASAKPFALPTPQVPTFVLTIGVGHALVVWSCPTTRRMLQLSVLLIVTVLTILGTSSSGRWSRFLPRSPRVMLSACCCSRQPFFALLPVAILLLCLIDFFLTVPVTIAFTFLLGGRCVSSTDSMRFLAHVCHVGSNEISKVDITHKFKI